MRSVSIRLADLQKVSIPIGFVGENIHTQVRIDCLKAFEEYPTAIPTLSVKPYKGTAYPAVIVHEGDYVIWTVTESDLTTPGIGEIQLSFVVDEVVAKSFIGQVRVDRSIVPSGDIPDPIDDWLTRAEAALAGIPATITASVESALEAAKESGEFDGADGVSPTISTEAIEGGHRITITDAEGTHVVELFNGAKGDKGDTGNGIASVVLNNDYTLTITYTNGQSVTTGSVRGPKGDPGNPGADGVSPTVAVADISGGHRVTITDASGTRSFDVLDGEDGQPGDPGQPGADGVSPTVTVTNITGGHRLTITDATGTRTVDVMDGAKGDKGDKGDPGQDADPSDLIDDTTASTSKTYSSNKLEQQRSDLLSAIQGKQDAPSSGAASGKVLGLNSSLQPVWVNNGGGGSVETDKTLQLADVPADAKATGDATNGTTSGNLMSGYSDEYYWKTDGTKPSSSAFCAVDPIDVSSYERISYSGAGAPGSSPVCLWLDDEDHILYYFKPIEAGETIIVPDGAKTIKFSVRKTNISTFSIVGKTHNVIGGINDEISDIYGQEHISSDLCDFRNGSIMSTDGSYDPSYNYRVAMPMKITAKNTLDLSIADGFRVYLFIFDSNGGKVSATWHTVKMTIEKGTIFKIMIARVTESSSETANIETFCSKVTYQNRLNFYNQQKQIDNNNANIPYGITWDWWITSKSIDAFGNAYIGYIDTDAYAGIIRRQPDGTMQYKRLEKSFNDDDHNAIATCVLDDGRILAIGSHGHTEDNHIICWRSKTPYSIDDMECLSFDISEGEYTYRTCYSQVFKYNGVLFDFLRFGAYRNNTSEFGYACLISTDNGSSWTVYKAINGTEGYYGIEHATDNNKYLKFVYAANPTSGSEYFRGFYIDLSNYKIYNLGGTQIGQMVELNGGTIVDESCANKEDMTTLIQQTESGVKRGRLFYTGKTPLAQTVFLYARATDNTDADFEYKIYNNGTSLDIGMSGTPFGNVHYLSGMCFGNSIDTIYYSTSTDSNSDGNHELHKVKLKNGAIESDEIITETSMCMIRPLFLGNGEIAVVVGHYNDPTQSGTFVDWELKPLFVHA